MWKTTLVIISSCFLFVTTATVKGNPDYPEPSTLLLPDSIVYRDTTGQFVDKYEYAYNQSGNYTLHAYYKPDSTNARTGIYKYTYAYDDNNNLTQYTSYAWNPATADWEQDAQYTYAYDANGNRTLYEYCRRDDGKWTGKVKYTDTYDAGNRLLLHISCSWDDASASWTNTCKSEYSYYPDGSPDESVDYLRHPSLDDWTEYVKYKHIHGNETDTVYNYTWNPTANHWQIARKYEYTNDAGGKQTSYIHSVWNSSSNDWTCCDKYEYTYPHANAVQCTGYEHDTSAGTWVSRTKYESTFDDSNRLLSHIYYSRMEDTHEWIPFIKHSFEYDEHGNLMTSTSETRDTTAMEWKNRHRSNSACDEQGNLTALSAYTWDSTSDQWQGEDRYEAVYDEDGHPLSVSGYAWDVENNRWTSLYLLEYEHDDDGSLLSFSDYEWNPAGNDRYVRKQYQYIYDEEYKRISEEKRYFRHTAASGMLPYETGRYYYPPSFGLSTYDPGINPKTLRIYPNPASGYMTVSVPGVVAGDISVCLFDVNGHVALQQDAAQTNHPILLRDVRPGVYFYRIKMDNSYYRGTVIVK
jgi:hypothetical protein